MERRRSLKALRTRGLTVAEVESCEERFLAGAKNSENLSQERRGPGGRSDQAPGVERRAHGPGD